MLKEETKSDDSDYEDKIRILNTSVDVDYLGEIDTANRTFACEAQFVLEWKMTKD